MRDYWGSFGFKIFISELLTRFCGGTGSKLCHHLHGSFGNADQHGSEDAGIGGSDFTGRSYISFHRYKEPRPDCII